MINLRIHIPVNIGELNNTKLNAIADVFKEDYPYIRAKLPFSLYLRNGDESKVISIESNIIKFKLQFDEKNAYKYFKLIYSDLNKIVNLLLIDSVFEIASISISHITDSKKNSMEITKNRFNDNLDLNKLGYNIDGIGNRYILKNNQNLYEDIKIEPFLMDEKYFYIERTWNIEDLDINNIYSILSNNNKEFIDLTEHIINNI